MWPTRPRIVGLVGHSWPNLGFRAQYGALWSNKPTSVCPELRDPNCPMTMTVTKALYRRGASVRAGDNARVNSAQQVQLYCNQPGIPVIVTVWLCEITWNYQNQRSSTQQAFDLISELARSPVSHSLANIYIQETMAFTIRPSLWNSQWLPYLSSTRGHHAYHTLRSAHSESLHWSLLKAASNPAKFDKPLHRGSIIP